MLRHLVSVLLVWPHIYQPFARGRTETTPNNTRDASSTEQTLQNTGLGYNTIEIDNSPGKPTSTAAQ